MSAAAMGRLKEIISDPRRKKAMATRAAVESGIRDFFTQKGFIETRTPLLVASPGMEPHIRPMEVLCDSQGRASEGKRVFLPTSPEFAMKKLLVGGLERIFQISPVFRSEPFSRTHHPEFTMLEWYRANAGEEEILRDVEELFVFLALKLKGCPRIEFQGERVDLAPPWPRNTVAELFEKHLNLKLAKLSDRSELAQKCKEYRLGVSRSDTWDDLFFKLWLNFIEPKLSAHRPQFVTRFPASQAALAVKVCDEHGALWAKRFEFFIARLELGNAFEELTDPVEQRARFEADMALRSRLYGPGFPVNPIDEEFIAALEEGLPPSGGIAVGVDRMVMLFADEPDIEYTHWLPSFWPAAEVDPDLKPQ